MPEKVKENEEGEGREKNEEEEEEEGAEEGGQEEGVPRQSSGTATSRVAFQTHLPWVLFHVLALIGSSSERTVRRTTARQPSRLF